LHNKLQCESPYVNRRVNVRLCLELWCTWARKYSMVHKLESLSWVVWKNVRDVYGLWTMYTLTFVKSYETFMARFFIQETFEVYMNSKISKGMIHFNVQVMFHETMWDMYPFLNNVGSVVTEIIWKFDHKFMDPNYVTTSIRRTIRTFYDIIWIMIV
jgi:hypothetical protein